MPKDVHIDFIEDMIYAVEDEEPQFFKFLSQTDPDSFGVYCSCGIYYMGWQSRGQIQKATCPKCEAASSIQDRTEFPALVSASEIITGKLNYACQ